MGNEYGEWLASLSLGDELLIRSGSYGLSIAHVDRITKARIFVGAQSFHRSGSRAGNKVGDSSSWQWTSIHPVTQEHRDQIAVSRLVKHMRDGVVWHKLPLATLHEVAAIVTKATGK